MTAIPVYILNLDRSPERLSCMQRQCRGLGIAYERVRGVDGVKVPAHLAEQFEKSALSPGEIGAYASHMLAWERLICDSDHPYAVILEDDAELAADLMMSIEQTIAWLPADWGVVQLYGAPNREAKLLHRLRTNRWVVRHSRIPSGAVAYLISRRGAQAMLRPARRHWPVDTDLRRPWHFGVDTYGIVPAPVTHSDLFSSTVLAYGERSRRRRGWRLFGNPLHSLSGFLWNVRKLGLRDWSQCAARNVPARRILQ